MDIFPNAKINIGLNILSKRPDGYHEIETLMYPIPLHDKLNVMASGNCEAFKYSSSGIRIESFLEDNLVYKAYKLLSNSFSIPPINVHLEKQIPFGGGLGGGSSDCAFMLSTLNKIFDFKIEDSKLEKYAAHLGSDCAFFIKNKPAIARGKGEKLTPFSLNLSGLYIVLVVPPVRISTPQAYSRVRPKPASYNLEEALKTDLSEWKNIIKNDFELSVFSHFPEIRQIKEELYQIGAEYASLSGSGSSVYGIFKKKPKLDYIFPEEYFVWDAKL